jgi:hypothetical protein
MISAHTGSYRESQCTENLQCPVCGAAGERLLLDVGEVPVNVTALHRSADAARRAPTGRLELTICPGCGHVRNRAFDAEAMTYDESYENALDFSPSFRAYRDALADELVERYHLTGRDVVEIGCGQGAFLASLCRADRARGTGFDPTHRPGDEVLPRSVRIVPTYFDPARGADGGDLLCARHVLEHIPDPLPFLEALRPAVRNVYLEVPSGDAVFGGDGCWDLLYQHVSYFSASTLVTLLERAGYGVTDVRPRFGAQYLSIEASGSGPSSIAAVDADGFVHRAIVGAGALTDRLAAARSRVDAGERVAVWGTGAKAVTFLNLLGAPVAAAVDLNPRKAGTFVAGTGTEIAPPDALRAIDPSTVFIFNPVYRDEIGDSLRAMGITAEVVLP